MGKSETGHRSNSPLEKALPQVFSGTKARPNFSTRRRRKRSGLSNRIRTFGTKDFFSQAICIICSSDHDGFKLIKLSSNNRDAHRILMLICLLHRLFVSAISSKAFSYKRFMCRTHSRKICPFLFKEICFPFRSKRG